MLSHRATKAERAEATIASLLADIPFGDRGLEFACDSRLAFVARAKAAKEAIYLTDGDGYLQFYNDAAQRMWGWEPPLRTQRWCGSWRLYTWNGVPLNHDESPMALALRRKRPLRGGRGVSERPDLSRIAFRPFPTPILSGDGSLMGGINLLLEVPMFVPTTGQLQVLSDRLRALNHAFTARQSVADLDHLTIQIEDVTQEVARATAWDLEDCARKMAVLEERMAMNLDPDDRGAALTLSIARTLRRDLDLFLS